jgi:hypothetical protein
MSSTRSAPATRSTSTEAFFEMVWGLANASVSGEEMPDQDRAAAMFGEYADEFRLGRPDPE